jgi:hypothetical protein
MQRCSCGVETFVSMVRPKGYRFIIDSSYTPTEARNTLRRRRLPDPIPRSGVGHSPGRRSQYSISGTRRLSAPKLWLDATTEHDEGVVASRTQQVMRSTSPTMTKVAQIASPGPLRPFCELCVEKSETKTKAGLANWIPTHGRRLRQEPWHHSVSLIRRNSLTSRQPLALHLPRPIGPCRYSRASCGNGTGPTGHDGIDAGRRHGIVGPGQASSSYESRQG